MKLLLVTRLYSGFELSLKNLIWNPEGVPTIYNLINGIIMKNLREYICYEYGLCCSFYVNADIFYPLCLLFNI